MADRVQDQRGCAADGPADQVSGPVPVVDFGEAPVYPDVFPVRAGGYVAERQRIRERFRRWCELAEQHRGQAAFLGFDVRARVVGDQAA